MCSLRDSRLARSCSLSVGGAARGAAGFLFGIGRGRRATGSPSLPAARTGKVMPALITFVNYARARGGAEPAAGRFSFCESGWRRSRSVRRRRRAQRATGSTSPPAACTGKLMARVDHFCALRARARRSRGRRRPIFFLRIRLAAQQECSAAAPSVASYGVDVAAGGLHRQADGPALITFVHYARARGGARRRRISFWHWPWPPSYGVAVAAGRSHRQGDARVDHFCELRARARRSRARRRPIFFLQIRLAAQQECSAAAPSAASYGDDVAAGGLHRQADGSRPCARSEISAVPFIRWRYGAARRAGLSNNREQGDC